MQEITASLQNFAFDRYRRSDVAKRCLWLQDNADADVNMLFAAAWLAQRGYAWRSNQVRELIAACSDWRQQCILPLRAVRNYLKARQPKTESAALYEQAKNLELGAEIHQLQRLQAMLGTMVLDLSDKSPIDMATENLHIYFDCIDRYRDAVYEAELRDFVEAINS